ncbi:MAG: GNAT family N-acetyltransferase [Minicystis sp.]
MHGEGVYGSLPYDTGKVRRMLHRYLDEPEEQCIFVSEHRSALVGMLGGYVDPYLFCDELVAQDTFFFVERPYRGLGVGARLVDAFRTWARARGARALWLTISSGICDDVVARRYEAMGLTRAGYLYRQTLE